MDSWVHCQRSARKFGAKCWQWTGLGFRHRILCPGICHPRWPSLHLFRPLVGRRVVRTGAGPTPCAGPHQHPWPRREVTVSPFDILRSPIASQRKCSVYLRGWVIFHLAACSILLFLTLFYKYLKRLGSFFLDWELVEGKKIQCHFFVISWQRWILETLKQVPTSYLSASTAMSCSKSLAFGALVHAASLSDLCDGTHGTDVPRAKTSELKLVTVNPQFTLIQAFQLMLGAIHLLYYSTHVLNFW